MAFVRKKRVAGGEYHQLVENYREGGKVRQRMLVHLGAIPTVEEALRVWPARADFYERRASDLRAGVRMIERGEAPGWRRPNWQAGRVGYLVPDTHTPERTPEVRQLIDLLGGSPEGMMCLMSSREGQKRAKEDERKAAKLREKVVRLRRPSTVGAASRVHIPTARKSGLPYEEPHEGDVDLLPLNPY